MCEQWFQSHMSFSCSSTSKHFFFGWGFGVELFIMAGTSDLQLFFIFFLCLAVRIPNDMMLVRLAILLEVSKHYDPKFTC